MCFNFWPHLEMLRVYSLLRAHVPGGAWETICVVGDQKASNLPTVLSLWPLFLEFLMNLDSFYEQSTKFY